MPTDFGPVPRVRGCFWRIVFIVVMIMVAIFIFFEPVRDRLMQIITGN